MASASLKLKPKLMKIQKTVRVPKVKAEILERYGLPEGLSFSDMVNQLIDAFIESKAVKENERN